MRHCDYSLNVAATSSRQGEMHPSCNEGYATGLCSEHTLYNKGGGEGESLAVLRIENEEELVKLILENPSILMNESRSALQVLDSRGFVVTHRPLERNQFARLKSTIETLSAVSLEYELRF